MSASRPFTEQTFGFGLRAMKKFPELIPLVSILGFACTMAGSFIVYSVYQKPDVALLKNQDSPPWERLDRTKKQKLFTHNCKYELIPELEELKKEIGSYKY